MTDFGQRATLTSDARARTSRTSHAVSFFQATRDCEHFRARGHASTRADIGHLQAANVGETRRERGSLSGLIVRCSDGLDCAAQPRSRSTIEKVTTVSTPKRAR
jgi:hypothetical protein